MLPEKPTPSRQSALSVGTFTPQEAERLKSMKHEVFTKAEYLDRVLDEHRLRFVRYLVEVGDISDVSEGDAT